MHPEQILQVNLMAWLEHHYPEVIDDVYHFAGERKCSIQQGRLLKRMGVRPGVADIFISVSRGTFKGAWIELKEGKGKPSPAQKEFLARMTVNGYFCACVTGLEAAQAVIKTYLTTNEYSHGRPIC
jgi:hypothetical protein